MSRAAQAIADGERFRAAGQLDRAIFAYRRALRLEPRAKRALAAAYLAKRWYVEAAAAFLGMRARAVRAALTSAAIALHRRGLELLDQADFRGAIDRIGRALAAGGEPRWAYDLARAYAAAGCADEASDALEEALSTDERLNAPGGDPVAPLELARLIAHGGAAELRSVMAVADSVGRVVAAMPQPPSFAREALAVFASLRGDEAGAYFAAFAMLGFGPGARRAWMDEVYGKLALPALLAACERDAAELALALETAIYNNYIKTEESEQHFAAALADFVPALRAMGTRLAARGDARGGVRTRLRTGFVLHTASTLAHAEVLFSFLESLSAEQRAQLDPVVYVLFGKMPAVTSIEERVPPNSGTLVRLEELKRQMRADGITVAVWISVVVGMTVAFAMRIAPVQIWWAMKYHSLELPEIDGYLTGGSLSGSRIIAGRRWHAGGVARRRWRLPEPHAGALEIRRRYAGAEIVLGTLGREEKLDSEPFLACVARILDQHPRAVFLWTGRQRLMRIQRYFTERGMAERTFFVGWVDTQVYAQVLDVFLDSFPFPCGFTALESMAVARPVLTFLSVESMATGVPSWVVPLLEDATRDGERAREIFRGGELFTCAKSEEDYVRLAGRLLGDATFRRTAGQAARRFIDEFFTDRARFAAGYLEAILDIARAQKK